MILLAAAAFATADRPAGPLIATAQARVSIRIISGTSLRVGANRSEEGHPVQRSTMRDRDGTRLAAMLVEFE